jgi:hypothetical protein
MEERDPKKHEAAEPVVMIIDRRSQRERDLSPAEIMKLVRKRSAKVLRREPGSGDKKAG